MTLLVGCLATAVTVGGEQVGLGGLRCNGPYKDRTLTPEELAAVLSNHQVWLESDRKPDDERRANLCQANLPGAQLSGANLQEASLSKANLEGAGLWDANLQGANLFRANLQGARLWEANLQGANLLGTNLRGALLVTTSLQDADLSRANLRGAIYEPHPGKLPHVWTLTHPGTHLDKLVFHTSPAGLIALREAFKKAGMRTQERQLTYAIEHTKMLQAWAPSWHDPKEVDRRSWLEQLAGKSESLFSYLLFELPSQYGMAPGRTLWGLLGLIPGFALLYWMALQNASRHSSLWMLVPADRLTGGRGRERVVRIRPQTAKTWQGRLVGELRLFRISLYFSLLSAFHLGWRELNVGTWIARLQSREYMLRATGWVRTVSGIQSLISVYLLALWVLTYFGRPFE